MGAGPVLSVVSGVVGPGICTILQANFRESAFRNCLKSLDGRKTKALGAYETEKKDSFRCGMPEISALDTPLSDFLDSFGRFILGSSR
jgi:hypothetical protein